MALDDEYRVEAIRETAAAVDHFRATLGYLQKVQKHSRLAAQGLGDVALIDELDAIDTEASNQLLLAMDAIKSTMADHGYRHVDDREFDE